MNRQEEVIIKEINNIVESFTEKQSIEAWNNYCERNHYEERIYYLSDETIDELFVVETPSELIRMGKDVDLDSKYFYFHLGELNTTDDIFDVVDIDELVDYIIDYDDDCGDSELRELLDELAEVRE